MTKDASFFLRLGDGTLYAHRPQIGREELDALTSRVPPADWAGSPPRCGIAAWATFVTATAARARILRRSHASGDHLAVALDYPLNLVPLHYLDVLNRPIVHDLSFSRVASLGDAIDIDRAIVGGPVASACLVVIPAADNADRELHMQSAEEAIDPIREMVTLRRIKEDDTDKSSVQYALRNAQLVHIQAHGFFPLASPAETVDPLLQAGLLVSSNGSGQIDRDPNFI
ncbi:CHAT domain-containing protein [Rhizobium beringeri]